MGLFESKLLNRVIIGKVIGLIGGIIGVIFMPMVFTNVETILIIGLVIWYMTLGSIIGIFGTWTSHPLVSFKISYIFRGLWIGAWMNFILVLFIHDNIAAITVGSIIEGWSPYWFILEGALFGLIVDFIATKYIGEGTKLVK